MENTLLIGDRVVVQKITDFKRGDVVVFADPGGWLDDESVEEPGPFDKVLEFIGLPTRSTPGHLIKRVIGMPGDKVVCCDSQGPDHRQRPAARRDVYLYTGPDGQVNPSDVRFQVVVPEGPDLRDGRPPRLSADSRCHLSDLSTRQGKGQVAFVPIKLVVGPAFAIAAPFGRATGCAARPPSPTSRRRPTCARRSGDLPGRGELLMPARATSAVLVKRDERDLRLRAGAEAGRLSTRSPAPMRPDAVPAPDRWSPPRPSSATPSLGRSPGSRTPSC